MFKKTDIKTFGRFKQFFIKLFGTKIVAREYDTDDVPSWAEYYQVISYLFRGRFYMVEFKLIPKHHQHFNCRCVLQPCLMKFVKGVYDGSDSPLPRQQQPPQEPYGFKPMPADKDALVSKVVTEKKQSCQPCDICKRETKEVSYF